MVGWNNIIEEVAYRCGSLQGRLYLKGYLVGWFIGANSGQPYRSRLRNMLPRNMTAQKYGESPSFDVMT